MSASSRTSVRRLSYAAVVTLVAVGAAGCGGSSTSGASASSTSSTSGNAARPAATSDGKVTVSNCGKDVTYPAPVTRLFANDGNIISIALAAGARPQLTAVSSLERDKEVIGLKFPGQLDGLNVVNAKYPTIENIVAATPQVVFAGWGYGFSESENLTPDTLAQHNIATYLLSESCRSGDGTKRGTMNPWDAVTFDITNIGALTDHADTAKKSVEELTTRRQALEKLPKPDKAPVVFLFDSGSDTVFSSGSFGAPQAIIEAAGGTNAIADVQDTWTKVTWERLTTAKPDLIAFVDYPPQTYQQKIDLLKSNPASKDLAAVKEGRFVNLPYAMWTSGPLNIDGAEYLRKAMESYGLVPKSDLTPGLDLKALPSLPGNEWLTK